MRNDGRKNPGGGGTPPLISLRGRVINCHPANWLGQAIGGRALRP